MVRKLRITAGVKRVAGLTAGVCLLLWCAPPAAAFAGGKARPVKASARPAAPQPEVQPLSDGEMAAIRGGGPYRNRYFSGVLPWQRAMRDVNLSTGNLFKSFTDIQVSPARGAGLALQRTYNSSDDRIGPFGIGWTHACDIRIEEAGNNNVPRTDFFGGKHTYKRDADGLYSPPPYMFDELSSDYNFFLANGPADVLSDDQKGMDGTVKHFERNGNERTIAWIEDRHGNRTNFTYGQAAVIDGVSKNLLTRVTDPSGRYLDIIWTDLNPGGTPMWRITGAAGPFDGFGNPVYRVAYEYYPDGNLWRVRQDPFGLNRITTYSYTTYTGAGGSESGLLASISDPLGHTVDYTYTVPAQYGTGTVWVNSITEPGPVGDRLSWQILVTAPASAGMAFTANVSSSFTGDSHVEVTSDAQLRTEWVVWPAAAREGTLYDYDDDNNIIGIDRYHVKDGVPPVVEVEKIRRTFGPHGNLLTEYLDGVPNSTTTTAYYQGSKYFQKESVTDPLGRVTRLDYFDNADPSPGNRGQVKWVRDARYGVTGQQFEYTYNPYGQKLTETNLNDVVTQNTYGDTWGNLTQVVQDPGGLGRATSMSYDAAGRVTQSTDPKNQSSSFAYNGVGQPTAATLPGETIAYAYGANGRTESVTDGRGTTVMSYLPDTDRVGSVADPVTGTVSYTYDTMGNRRFVTLPGGGQWEYQYQYSRWSAAEDDVNKSTPLLAKVIDDQGREVAYSFDNYGMLRTATSNQSYVGGALAQYQLSEYTYPIATGRSWLTRLKHTWNWKDGNGAWQSRLLVQNDYTYDNNGQRLTNTITDAAGARTESYGYDELSRLTSVNYGDGQTQGYGFDAMGNRLTKTDSVTGNDTLTYNAANMLLTRNGAAYTSDPNGNTLTGGGRTNTWDGQNRLVQCVFNGTTTSHTYGSDGLRRRTVQGTSTTDYVVDGQSVVRTLANGCSSRIRR